MKDITFSASVLCFLLPIQSNCLLLNELDEKYANGDLDPLNLVKSYQQRFWPIASKYPNSPEK